jgi:hypothetical protein
MVSHPAITMSLALALAFLPAAGLRADDQWTGTAGNGAWSTDANWLDGTAPSTAGGGVVVFDNAGMGTNTVDLDWTISALIFSNNVPSGHTTVVAAGRTLVINGVNGSLTVGQGRSNGVVAIMGGSVQLGDAVRAVDLLAGSGTGGMYTNPPNRLRLATTLDARQLRSVHVGRQSGTGGGTGMAGELDLAGSTISQGALANRLAARELVVAGGGGRYPRGVLRLPSALTNLEVGFLDLARGNGGYGGLATVDFGPGSQLATLTVTGNLYLARNGTLVISNWPAGVVVTVGSAGAPADMAVGCSDGDSLCQATWSLTNGSLTAHLATLMVGCIPVILSGSSATGWLDLSQTTVQIGPTPNRVGLAVLGIGGGGGRDPAGTLRLPATVTALEVGTLDMARGNGAYGGLATLDFSPGSQLSILTVSNDCHLAKNGFAAISNWPAGVTVTVGSAASPAVMTVGCSEGEGGCGATLALTNGRFTAHLSSLAIGCITPVVSGSSAAGRLDLSQTEVQIGPTPNRIGLPSLAVGGGGGRDPSGTLSLPPSVTAIELGTLDMASGSLGFGGNAVWDFGPGSQLSILTVSNDCHLAKNGSLTLSNWPAGVTVTVGSAASPAAMSVGCTEGATLSGATLALTNGRFTAHLASLRIGCGTYLNSGSTHGVLDLSQTAVQIGPAQNRVGLPELMIGADVGRGPTGTLRLAASVSAIEVGTLDMAHGYATLGGAATLDFGAGSLCRRLVASNAWYLGRNGRVNLPNWPAGITVVVGSADSPAPMTVGCGNGKAAVGAELTMVGGRFEARLASLEVGVNRHISSGSTTGILDLSGTTLGALDVLGNLAVGASTTACINGKGFLRLPAGEARVGGDLLVGDTHTGSAGRLDLAATRLRVVSNVIIEATGVISNRLTGYAGGLDLASADPASLQIAAGGRLHLAFEADPVSTRGPYWGLRMAGDQAAAFAALQAAGRLTWSLDGLSPAQQARFGIHVLASANITYVGVPPPAGAMLTVR